MNYTKKVRVIITDDHQIIIDGIRSILEGEEFIEITGEANNGRQALDLLSLTGADIVLLDLEMPVMNGIETARLIKKGFPQVHIIILSMYLEKGLINKLIEMGADGYLLKNSDKSDLLAAIKKVMAGGKYFSSDITIALADKSASSAIHVSDAPHGFDLTEREVEILKYIAEGFSNKEIGEKLFISHRTVDTHRTNLMKKIGVNNIAGLIRFAIKNGFLT
ncbi:MAG: response regulator transcription factor [Bacteroidales bacterium]|nr:response regulator transcription factor [Bacteroidales bacterium]